MKIHYYTTDTIDGITITSENYVDIFDDWFITEHQLVQIGKVLKATKLKYYDIVTKSDKEIDIKKYRKPRERKWDIGVDIFNFKENKVEHYPLGKIKPSDLSKLFYTKEQYER
jgi:hypothetical protein